ncbi:Transcriptional regulator, ArsR family [Halalkaliarchaeum sp. AArc-CO]|uniref:ArsR/SmtB family transcription factor n=1 Tax=unclassified Halalkaliarchaeum TaxID=2678344 RepID=UPI00217D20CB|nr:MULTISPECIES: ArsR family transcriptional regulator [unclassified Halalkaliarchaeum]MDR5672351.1 ArsR family transcriptional regulator [Halalkaliarchaeum sp. AArc-GB]UWG50028.1 Transcriptional regulator, ArsR family [Halalkaliarchaeum sp. AArc-CO]
MDSAVLLDLLGNENRRRILRLLSQKPCYVTEISEYLGVSPKAVIDHLRKLEEAGLIESVTDQKRRKYFHISRSVRLEVSLSPYSFDAKSAYPANLDLDMNGRCPHLSVEIPESDGPADVEELAAEYEDLRDLTRELSIAQRWVHGRLTEVLDQFSDYLGTEADSQFYAEVLAAVAATDGTPSAVAAEMNARRETVEEALVVLGNRGLLARRGNRFEIP